MVDRILDGAMEDEDVAGVTVHQPNVAVPEGANVFNRRRDAQWHAITGAPSLFGSAITEKRSIVYGGKTIGSLELVSTPRWTDVRIRANFLIYIGVIFLVDFILVACLHALLRREIITPLKVIGEFAGRVTSGNGDFVGAPQGRYHGELEGLRSSIETMVTLLQDRYAALKASEELLRHCIKHTPAAVAMFDTKMCYLQASDRWIADYHLEGMDVIGRSHYEVFPDVPERWKEVHHRALRGQTEHCDEDVFPRADGDLEWLQWEVRPWNASENVIGGVIMFTQVITERKHTELKLRESEELFRTSFESATVGVCLVATNGRFLNVNRTLCSMLGYAREELLQLTFNDVTHEEDKGTSLTFLSNALSGGPKTLQTEKRYLHKDGRVVWAFLSTALVAQSREQGGYMISYIQDITERKRTEAAVRESEERYRLLADHSDDIVMLNDTKGNRLYISPSLFRKTGWTMEEFADPRQNRMHPDDLALVNATREKNLAGEATSIENRARCRDGSWLWFETHCKPITGPDGKVWRLLVWSHDITERKRATEQLEMLKVTIDQHFDAAYWMDADNQFVYVNDSACKALGYFREELLGKPVTMIAPNATPQNLQEVWKRLRESGFFTRESVHRRKDGSEFPVEIVASHVCFEGKEFNCGFARNITERKRAEEILREKQAQLIFAMDIAKLAHWEFDIEKNTFTGDEHIFQLLGASAEQEGGLSMSPEEYIRKFVHPEDAGIVASEVAMGIAATDPNFARQFEHRILCRDGAERVMMVRSRILTDALGRSSKILGTN